MRHLLLVGEYDLTIDDKNRLLVPAEVRRSIVPERDGEAFYFVIGVNERLWLYPELYYEGLTALEKPELIPDADQVAYNQVVYSMATRIEWDKQGRVLVPEKLLKRAGLEREITMIGARDHLELWNRPDWERHREDLLKRSAEIALRAKQARAKTP